MPVPGLHAYYRGEAKRLGKITTHIQEKIGKLQEQQQLLLEKKVEAEEWLKTHDSKTGVKMAVIEGQQEASA